MHDLTDGAGRLCIVGVGASAGGLEAIREMLAPAEPDANLAYVVIQHLDPNHESLLAELLGRHTALEVLQASGGERVSRGRVYIIPPGHGLEIQDGTLQLTDFAQPRGLRRPIDDFFESLAADQGRDAACVILSGTGADGSSGLRAIKEHGGLCIAQEPETARYDGMPMAAKGTGLVDFLRSPDQIVDCVVQFQAHRARLESGENLSRTLAESLDDICAVVRGGTGHDFAGYKRSTLLRRVERRIQVLNLRDATEYLQRIRDDASECETLFRELLINVTRFFRDPEHFDTLRAQVIEPLVSGATEDEIRVWVPGCSSGEEAYSLAMLFAEEVRLQRRSIMIQIFATDIDEQMLAQARQGAYPLSAMLDIPEEMRDRYALPQEGRFRVASRIRDLVRFSSHSVVRDPPFSNIDLVSCRNMLIYLGDQLQAKAIPVFHYALRPGGALFLGPSETVGRHDDLFQPIDQRARIFRRADGAPGYPLHLAAQQAGERRGPRETPREGRASRVEWRNNVAADRILNAYAPPTLHVTASGEVLSSTGRLGKYLSVQPAGERRRFAQAMALPGLREAMSALVRQAADSGRRAVSRDLSAVSELGRQRFDLIADPLPDRTLLLIFRDRDRFEPMEEDDLEDLEPSDGHVQSLEEELRAARARLNTTVEELETANEELKSSNEEMMSMNEELQSTNEELATVNDELKSKVDELSVANADLHNFFSSTALPLVSVDGRLSIRNFTDAIQSIYPFRGADRGRPLTDVTSSLENPEAVLEQVSRVMKDGEPRQMRVTERDGGRVWSLLTTPYRTRENEVDGATLVFTDVTAALKLENALEEESDRLRLALDVANLGVWEYDPVEGRITLDETSRRHLGLRPRHPAVSPLERIQARVAEEGRAAFAEAFASQRDVDLTLRVVARDGSERILRWVGRPVSSRRTAQRMGVLFDVTVEQEAADVRDLMLREMNHRLKNLFSIILGILRGVAREAETPADVVSGVDRRVQALARSHDLTLSELDARGVSLEHVVRTAIAPYAEETAVTVEGPDLAVDESQLTPLSLLLHEWATNAAKYGVLGPAPGRLAVSWEVTGDGHAEIAWQEIYDEAHPSEEGKQGFGAVLSRLGAAQLKGTLYVDVSDRRRVMRLSFPVET